MKSDIWSLGCVLYESITLRPPFRADDMAGLYKKVLRGMYSKIPDHFSSDLADVTKSLVQVQAQMRPDCDKILGMPAVIRMGEKLFGEEFYDDIRPIQNELLSTIRVPKNLLYLTDRLPKPHYDSEARRNNRSQNLPGDEDPKSSRRNQLQANLPDLKKGKHGRNKRQYETVNAKDEPNVAQSQALPTIDR